MAPTRDRIVPVFIPHLGCPHQCVFCNQKSISGTSQAPTPIEVESFLNEHIKPGRPDTVIAFYGGSFTALPRAEQEGYFGAAAGFIKAGLAKGVRLSTRPDCIDADTLSFLKEHGVITVELGVQSFDDEVLRRSGRGHTAADSTLAARLVKESGLELGIQLMAGLPGDDSQLCHSRECGNPGPFHFAVLRTIDLAPSFVRIYPALVVGGSPLEALWRRGEYAPLSLDEAVRLCAWAVKAFRAAGIRVIRVGLQAGRELEGALLAGPYHPAFGHMVESAIALERMREALAGVPAGAAVEFRVNPREVSVYKGIKGANVEALMALRGVGEVVVKGDECVCKGGMETKLM